MLSVGGKIKAERKIIYSNALYFPEHLDVKNTPMLPRMLHTLAELASLLEARGAFLRPRLDWAFALADPLVGANI
jgi:hypothetical protein